MGIGSTVSLATAMTIFGFLVAVNAMKRSAAMGQLGAGVAFAIVPLSGILFFAVVLGLAIAKTRQPETHKRLMLLAAISILDAAVARWFLTFLAPPGPPGPPPVPVTIGPAMVAYLLLVVAIVATDAVVLWPGTSSTRITAPPAASTTSWPTTSSRR